MPGKVAPDRLAALRTAFDVMVADAAFLAEAQRSGLTVTPMTGSAVDREIAELYATPAGILARARSIAGE
jgi:tripartite-type tricarboxylate transporter receptor subunit TctC